MAAHARTTTLVSAAEHLCRTSRDLIWALFSGQSILRVYTSVIFTHGVLPIAFVAHHDCLLVDCSWH